ncbi:MAG: hypothetical protein ACXIUD_14025 [Mongoliitalea sp.]
MKNPHQDLEEIKSMMDRSKRFLSLSGIAGIPVGFIALAGVTAINVFINDSWFNWRFPVTVSFNQAEIITILIISFLTFSLALGITWYLSQRKSVQSKKGNLYSPASKKFLQSLGFPMLIGALVCGILAWNKDYSFIFGMSLLFYGLGMYQASEHSFKELKFLGIGCLMLGLIALVEPSLSLLLWAGGFGVLHILYGILMHVKYDK